MAHISYFNPRDVPAEILAILSVGRDDLLDEVIADVRAQATSDGNQHWHIWGPLGIGKSHFVALLAERIRIELPDTWIAVQLPEASHMRMSSASRILEAVVAQLRDELVRAGSNAAWILEDGDPFAGIAREERFEHAAAILRETRHETGRKIAVLIENFDEVMSRIRKAPERRALREFLQTETASLWIATSPLKWLPRTAHDKELFQMFRDRELQRLDVAQVGEVIRRVAQLTGNTRAADRLMHPPGRLQTIHALTGGNPRLVVMLADAIANDDRIGGVYEGLKRLLDDQTRYFEARIEMMAPQEQDVLTTYCDAEHNLTPSEVADAIGLPVNQVSEIVGRLLAHGALAPAGPTRRRGNRYTVSDDLLRLWYQYRFGDGDGTIRRVVAFLALWYERDELDDLLVDARQRLTAPDLAPLQRADLQGVERSLAKAIEQRPLWLAFERSRQRGDEGENEPLDLDGLRTELERLEATGDGASLDAHTLRVQIGACIGNSGDHEAAIKLFDHVIAALAPATTEAARRTHRVALCNRYEAYFRRPSSGPPTAATEGMLVAFDGIDPDAVPTASHHAVVGAYLTAAESAGKSGDNEGAERYSHQAETWAATLTDGNTLTEIARLRAVALTALGRHDAADSWVERLLKPTVAMDEKDRQNGLKTVVAVITHVAHQGMWDRAGTLLSRTAAASTEAEWSAPALFFEKLAGIAVRQARDAMPLETLKRSIQALLVALRISPKASAEVVAAALLECAQAAEQLDGAEVCKRTMRDVATSDRLATASPMRFVAQIGIAMMRASAVEPVEAAALLEEQFNAHLEHDDERVAAMHGRAGQELLSRLDRQGQVDRLAPLVNDILERATWADSPRQALVMQAQNLRGVLHGRAGEHEAAAACFEEFIERWAGAASPENQRFVRGVMLNACTANQRRGRLDRAAAHLERCWQALPPGELDSAEAARLAKVADGFSGHRGERAGARVLDGLHDRIPTASGLGVRRAAAWLYANEPQRAELAWHQALAGPAIRVIVGGQEEVVAAAARFLLGSLARRGKPAQDVRTDLDAALGKRLEASAGETIGDFEPLRALHHVIDYFGELQANGVDRTTAQRRAERSLEQVPMEIRAAVQGLVRTASEEG